MGYQTELQWQKGRDGWILLERLNIQSKELNDVYGIYILWNNKGVAKVGMGRIRDELATDRTKREITETDGLMVTWAVVDSGEADNILRFLNRELNPRVLVNPVTTNEEETCVNLPWDVKLNLIP